LSERDNKEIPIVKEEETNDAEVLGISVSLIHNGVNVIIIAAWYGFNLNVVDCATGTSRSSLLRSAGLSPVYFPLALSPTAASLALFSLSLSSRFSPFWWFLVAGSMFCRFFVAGLFDE
jgi:hypothetical protein